MKDYSWVAEIALEAKMYSSSIGAYFSKTFSKVTFDPITDNEMKHAWAILIRDAVNFGFGQEIESNQDVDETMMALKTLGIDKYNQDLVNEEKLTPLLTQFFEKTFDLIAHNPEIFYLLDEKEIVEEIIGIIGARFIPFFHLFPLFSNEAVSTLPYLQEPLFTAFYEISEIDQLKLTRITEKIIHQFYRIETRPKLVETLNKSLKGSHLLLPIIDEAIKHLPADKCMTSLICILCTPKNELTQGRVISIILQELGGMYVKLSQVLAEIAPPGLSKELKLQQDKVGGIFGSQLKSWKYVLNIFNRPSWKKLVDYIHIPDQVQKSFAGASVGAIYEFKLTELGKRELNTNGPVLIKIQRPFLAQLFESQKDTLILILDKMISNINSSIFYGNDKIKLIGIILVIKRTIINYAHQSISELDFRKEKKNAQIIREALGEKFNLKIPHYYHVESDVSIMEKIEGDKITSVVHSKYLERISIADTVSAAYFYLMFNKGIIWADPHAGNILYDPVLQQVKLVDLNPCFFWNSKTIKIFTRFLYGLILSDSKSVMSSLHELVDSSDPLESESTKKLIESFVTNGNQGAFIRNLSEFVRLLGEENINLKIEIQAALRGITQVYLTSSAISSGHNFGQIFQKQLGWEVLIRHIISVGPFRIAKAALPIAFDLIKNSPEQEVGPTLDERDISAIESALLMLNQENVCNIELVRVSPDENTRLLLSTDGTRLIKSTYLKIEILTETKPASVRYILELPSKEWLKERQEYIKLQGMGLAFCVVECLEQLRRHSLEDYWHIVEGWNNRPEERTYGESMLLSDMKLAARNLFAKRYANIWTSEFMTVSWWNKFLWKLLFWFEQMLEKREAVNFYLISKKMRNNKVCRTSLGPFHSIKVIIFRLIIQGLKTIIRRNRFEMNLLPLTTDQLIERMIHGLLRKGS